MVVQHNLTAMNSNRMLGITTGSQAKSTEKLSSGYKINRAADDAAGLSISEKMRKQIRGLSQASLNAEDGISSVQTAEGALNEVQDMLQRMNELAVKAANGTMSEDDRSYIQNEIDQLTTEIDRVAETTKFNETYLLKGDNTATAKKTFEYKQKQYTADSILYDATGGEVQKGTVLDPTKTYYSKRTAALDNASAADPDDKDNTLFHAATVTLDKAVYVKDANGDASLVAIGKEIEIGTKIYGSAIDAAQDAHGFELSAAVIDGTGNKDAYSTGGLDIVAATNGLTSDGATPFGDITVTVSKATADIKLYQKVGSEIETVEAGTKVDVTATNIANLSKAVAYTTASADAVTSADFANYGNDVQLMDADGNEVAANGLYNYFDKDGNYEGGLYKLTTNEDGKNELTEITTQAEALTYVDNTKTKETGALMLSLHVGADATENNQISVEIDAMSASSLGIEGLKVDGKDDYNALRAIETIKASIQQVSEQRSALGAVQNRLEHTIANLDNVVENTTAAESQIRDTDMASEMVKYSNNNILAQAGQAMLAQANQANQGVLSLLG